MEIFWDGKTVAKAACGYRFCSEMYSPVAAVSWVLTPPCFLFYFPEMLNEKTTRRQHANIITCLSDLSRQCSSSLAWLEIFKDLGPNFVYITALGQPTMHCCKQCKSWINFNFIFIFFLSLSITYLSSSIYVLFENVLYLKK